MLTANPYDDTAMSFRTSVPLRSRSTASRGRRSGKPARSWRWPILAVVLGLFAHQEALAQPALGTLILTESGDTTDLLSPTFDSTADPEQRSFTASVAFGVTQVTVTATSTDDALWRVTFLGADDENGDPTDGYQRDLTLRTNTITVRATSLASPPAAARDYTITVTRAAEIGSALSGLDLFEGTGTVTEIPLDPPDFDPDMEDRTFTADVALSVAMLTVRAVAKPGWTVEYRGEPDADGGSAHYQRRLAPLPDTNTITVRATPTGASGPRDYTITVRQTTTPGPPGNLRPTPFDRSVRLSWTAPSFDGGSDITGYDYRAKDANDDNGQWTNGDMWASISESNASTTSYDVRTLTDAARTSLVNGTTYMFQVRARNDNSAAVGSPHPQGRASNTVEATPAGGLPAPESLTATAGHRRVTLSWMHVADGSVTGYQYQRSVGAGSFGGWTNIADRDLVVVSDTARSYTVTGLTNGTDYSFRVRAVNSVGGGAASNIASATPMGRAPSPPTNLSAVAGDKRVTLSWGVPADNGGEPITGYEYRSREQTGDYPVDGNGVAVWTPTGGTARTVIVYRLDNGKDYFFQVRAVSRLGCTSDEMSGCGQPSLEIPATPSGAPETLVSLDLAMSDQDRQARLEWSLRTETTTTPPDFSGYQYRQKAASGYGDWIDTAGTVMTHVVGGLTNGTAYTFQVRVVNAAGVGGLASNEQSATPSTTPGAPTLTATAGDEEVRLRWTPPTDNGGRPISGYRCQWRTGAETTYTDCPRTSRGLAAGARSLTLTYDDGIRINTTYAFQVRAVSARQVTDDPEAGNGDWSDEASARIGARSYAISATIDGKSWTKVPATGTTYPLSVTVEVNPRFREQTTELWVKVNSSVVGGTVTADGRDVTGRAVTFGPADSRRDASFTVAPSSAGDYTIALLMSSGDDDDTALAVTSVEIRPLTTPEPPTGLRATRGDGEVTLSWATVKDEQGDRAQAGYDWHYRQRQSGAYGRWTNFARDELVSDAVTSNTVTGLDGGTYAFQVRALIAATPTAASDPSDEVTVSLSGTVDTGGLSAPRDLEAAPGNGLVTLSWTAPATDGGSAITEYQYQQRAGTGAYGQWATIPGGPLARAHTVTGLANGTRYLFRVRAVNSDGPGAASTEESATPTSGVDTTLRALSLSVGTLAPAFTPATRIYTAAVGSSAAQVTVTATPNKQGATRTITPADANTTVAGHQVALAVGSNRIRVRVTDGTNTGDYTITVTRAGSVPAAPTRLTATADGERGGAVTLAWTAPTGGGAVSRYEYQQKAGTRAYGAWTPIPGSGPSTTSHIVTGLTDGTAYAFRVRAVNSVGNGAASNEATATPATVRLVWAKTEREVADAITAARNAGYGDDNTFTAGETVEVRGSSLFNAAEGVSVTFAATSDDRGVASAAESDGTVTVTARAAGMATITITARAPQSGVTIVEQTDPREASIQFDVEVGLEALTLELSGPEDGTNLVEGGRAHANGTAGTVTVRATANRPVTEEVTVTLLPDRAMSDATATADDFTADPIVIEAGETTGLTVVIAVEDETAEGMEELVLFGVAAGNAGEVTGEVRLRLWDAAVPALPVIAQLLLAAFLLWVSGRRYLLRR